MPYRGKYSKILDMEDSFLSKFRKHLRGFLALCFLIASLLGTHWIGFAHSITHSDIHHQTVELSCTDQAPATGHSFESCHLLDALTLAGFVASTSNLFLPSDLSQEAHLASNNPSPARIQIGLYQSRAPPTFIL
jgi:hypothetical protein